jgi:hypothetical protein
MLGPVEGIFEGIRLEVMRRIPKSKDTIHDHCVDIGAYALRSDKQKACVTREKLLNLWKDADPNLPLLKQAKAEFAKLQ